MICNWYPRVSRYCMFSVGGGVMGVVVLHNTRDVHAAPYFYATTPMMLLMHKSILWHREGRRRRTDDSRELPITWLWVHSQRHLECAAQVCGHKPSNHYNNNILLGLFPSNHGMPVYSLGPHIEPIEVLADLRFIPFVHPLTDYVEPAS